MFNISLLKASASALLWFDRLRTDSTFRMGRFCELTTPEAVRDALCHARYLEVKKLPKRQQTIYVTHDLGPGYMDHMSLRLLLEFVQLQRIPATVSLRCQYLGGNIFTYLSSRDIDTALLRTDEVYIFVDDRTQQLLNVKIGKPSNPNHLYFQEQYDGQCFTPREAAHIPGLNTVWIDDSIVGDWL